MRKPVQTATCPTDTAVELTGVTKTFLQYQRSDRTRGALRGLLHPQRKTITALDDISFAVQRGEFVAYAGPNGAGKSTTMKLLCGMLLPASGQVSALGLSPRSQRIPLMRRTGILFGNRTELWWDHPVVQSFAWKRVVWDIPRAQYDASLALVTELLDLKDILHTFARELSLGQRMKADLAMVLLHSPELLLLDEPTIGLDVLAKRQMIRFLKTLNREQGTTIVVTSHDMDDLEEMARRVLLISQGRLAFDGSFAALRQSTGGMGRLVLTLSGGATPVLPCARLVSREGDVCLYEYDAAQASRQALLREVAGLTHVTDLELRKAPIEEVIAGLYTQWRQQPT